MTGEAQAHAEQVAQVRLVVNNQYARHC
jgi:hypothetical protein